ncbi:MAG: DUF1134 domain-containing protein, partial [Sandarakinorhabdus sp.]|nr:DUF1134 domain-containing protein [Sandarakinorhabdus sp.]
MRALLCSSAALALLIGGAAPLAAQSQAPAPVSAPAPATAPQLPPEPAPTTDAAAAAAVPLQPAGDGATFAEQDVLGAAEDVFGKGVQGLAEAIRKSFKAYGQPNAYIVGREAGGAFIVGVRYGSGILHHKIEGDRAVNWAGPSVGVDVGADGSKVFALVYNLNDTEELFTRFASAGG